MLRLHQVTFYVMAHDVEGALQEARTHGSEYVDARLAYCRRRSDPLLQVEAEGLRESVEELAPPHIPMRPRRDTDPPYDPRNGQCVFIVSVGRTSKRCRLPRNHHGEHEADA